jgi:hypothetical protein
VVSEGTVVRGDGGRIRWRVAGLAGAFVLAELVQYGAFLLSWLVLGRAALDGSVDGGTVLGWAAAMAGSFAGAAATVRLQAALAVLAGTRLRTRLLAGALGLDRPELIRTGTARLLGRLLESETLEDQIIGEPLRNLGAPLDLVLAAALLGAALGPAAALILAAFLAAAGYATARYAACRTGWTAARLALGDDLTDKLAGHRTRAVQQPESRWHTGEAEALDRYTATAGPMDRWHAVLAVLIPRGWALAGVTLLSLSAATHHASQATLAAGAAGVLFTTAALARVSAALIGIADARAAYHHLRPLLRAPAPQPPTATPGTLTLPPADQNHLLLAPLAMNLLLGRGWPPTPQDLRDAEDTCHALGLGDLIDRMPSGLAQLVGETGWQLSAGERSLVFLARALLQNPAALVADQTLDALDPATRVTALTVANRRPA